MTGSVSFVVATGVKGNSQPERNLNGALEANTRDLLEMAGSVPSIENRILITNSNSLIELYGPNSSDVALEESSDNFHFGRSLFNVIKDYDINKLLYAGGGSGPLMEEGDLEIIASFLESSKNRLLANNFYSSDMIGISSAKKILGLDPPEKDNGLGWLARDAGLEPHEMPRNAKTQLDLDTPVDLIPLMISQRSTEKLNDYLGSLNPDNTRIREILPQFTDQNARLVIAGRAGASTWSFLEKSSACQLDVLSEGRGSYDLNGESRSANWLGSLFDKLAPEEFVKFFTDNGTGFFLDTRVLFDYLGNWPSRRDRFSSDLLDFESIEVDYLKRLTRVAREFPKPVVLGGHSMVSGSLYLLSEAAWQMTEPKSVNVQPSTFRLEETD
jgi:hypothetical protein